jgi:hypothetical protein
VASTLKWVEINPTVVDINLRLKPTIIFPEIRKNSATENCLPFTITSLNHAGVCLQGQKIISDFKNFGRK